MDIGAITQDSTWEDASKDIDNVFTIATKELVDIPLQTFALHKIPFLLDKTILDIGGIIVKSYKDMRVSLKSAKNSILTMCNYMDALKNISVQKATQMVREFFDSIFATKSVEKFISITVVLLNALKLLLSELRNRIFLTAIRQMAQFYDDLETIYNNDNNNRFVVETGFYFMTVVDEGYIHGKTAIVDDCALQFANRVIDISQQSDVFLKVTNGIWLRHTILQLESSHFTIYSTLGLATKFMQTVYGNVMHDVLQHMNEVVGSKELDPLKLPKMRDVMEELLKHTTDQQDGMEDCISLIDMFMKNATKSQTKRNKTITNHMINILTQLFFDEDIDGEAFIQLFTEKNGLLPSEYIGFYNVINKLASARFISEIGSQSESNSVYAKIEGYPWENNDDELKFLNQIDQLYVDELEELVTDLNTQLVNADNEYKQERETTEYQSTSVTENTELALVNSMKSNSAVGIIRHAHGSLVQDSRLIKIQQKRDLLRVKLNYITRAIGQRKSVVRKREYRYRIIALIMLLGLALYTYNMFITWRGWNSPWVVEQVHQAQENLANTQSSSSTTTDTGQGTFFGSRPQTIRPLVEFNSAGYSDFFTKNAGNIVGVELVSMFDAIDYRTILSIAYYVLDGRFITMVQIPQYVATFTLLASAVRATRALFGSAWFLTTEALVATHNLVFEDLLGNTRVGNRRLQYRDNRDVDITYQQLYWKRLRNSIFTGIAYPAATIVATRAAMMLTAVNNAAALGSIVFSIFDPIGMVSRLTDYFRQRLTAYTDPLSTLQNSNYQTLLAPFMIDATVANDIMPFDLDQRTVEGPMMTLEELAARIDRKQLSDAEKATLAELKFKSQEKRIEAEKEAKKKRKKEKKNLELSSEEDNDNNDVETVERVDFTKFLK